MPFNRFNHYTLQYFVYERMHIFMYSVTHICFFTGKLVPCTHLLPYAFGELFHTFEIVLATFDTVGFVSDEAACATRRVLTVALTILFLIHHFSGEEKK